MDTHTLIQMCTRAQKKTQIILSFCPPYSSCRYTQESTDRKRDEKISWHCHSQCVYLWLHVCACYMYVYWEMGFLCQLPHAVCHNISWYRSITESSFPSSITVFDGSVSSRVTWQNVIWKAERVVHCWLPCIKDNLCTQFQGAWIEEKGEKDSCQIIEYCPNILGHYKLF